MSHVVSFAYIISADHNKERSGVGKHCKLIAYFVVFCDHFGVIVCECLHEFLAHWLIIAGLFEAIVLIR